MPPLVKTVSCAEKVAHGSDLISPQLCQVKNLDGKNIRHVYLLGKNINKPCLNTIKRVIIVQQYKYMKEYIIFVKSIKVHSGTFRC